MQRPTAEDTLSEEELDRLLALLLTMADAGLRVSETTALTTSNLVGEGGQQVLSTRKEEQRRTVQA